MLYMPYGRFVCLALVLVSSAVHLFVPKKKDFTKALLLPMLLFYYLASSHTPSWVVVAALIFSWLGDVLLIPNGTKWFVAGGIAFIGCFYEKKKHDTFLPVMATYILGELLITQGLIAA